MYKILNLKVSLGWYGPDIISSEEEETQRMDTGKTNMKKYAKWTHYVLMDD